jgi:hypothetical protein
VSYVAAASIPAIRGVKVTFHHINDQSDPLFTASNAHNRDIFDLTARG